MSKAFEFDDALQTSKAAELVRGDILERSMQFDGVFQENCQETAVPLSLIELIVMIEHGSDIQSQLRMKHLNRI